MKKNGTTFSRTADGTDLCDTKGSVEGIPAADGYACGTQLELAVIRLYHSPYCRWRISAVLLYVFGPATKYRSDKICKKVDLGF